ncbi:malonyl-CoA decarboxylase, mitochondrial [Elysia marginata]|uniref:Malonyl-CoA decarboxylase, mitochondrial n=1 Tax=Elysia marginata TaxID=1093978 RepID=A0AAV4GIE1_9GAST|nr:malonyl-CoA decarboxylase, mitochondrial [Elysia marginata]
MRLVMEALRRLQHISLIMQPQISSTLGVKRSYSVMSGTSDDGNFLQTTFSDINSNLMTTETHCSNFMRYYKDLPQDRKGPFLCLLAEKYGIDRGDFVSIAKIVSATKDKDNPNVLAAAERMRMTLRPKHKTLFTHLSRVPGGVKFLVDLRADILNLKQSNVSQMDSALCQELNSTLRELLSLWFTVGFLSLERITWNSPCDLVQKVSRYEAVHRIKTWLDIKQRVGPYRRCYIFTHNSMPREPVVVLHTALTKEIAFSIQTIIQDPRFQPSFSPQSSEEKPKNSSELESYKSAIKDSLPPSPPMSPDSTDPMAMSLEKMPADGEEYEDPSQINSAVFYSITSTQKGLQGVEMGNYLIKAVVKKLQEEFPHLRQFSSLSPIPGFRDWLLTMVKHSITVRQVGQDPGVPVLLPEELSLLEPFKQMDEQSPLDTFRNLVQSHGWFTNVEQTRAMIGPLMRLCAHYLYIQKRRGYALNPVANFHLSNGAVLWRINFLADTSHRGLTQSCTLMVNYRYFLDSTEANSRNYLERHHIVASPSVLSILNSGGKTTRS